MNNLELRLHPAHFRRIHRSAIVNLRAVQAIETQTHGDGIVILHNGTRLKLSRTRKQQFLDAL
jgi:two-component system, LytTR family, response regulator